MTQELVVWALVAGLIGLIWVMTCVVLTEDRSVGDSVGDGAEAQDNDQAERSSPTQRRVAA